MLLEDLLSLPLGTRVYGEIEVPATLPGVVASRRDGPHFNPLGRRIFLDSTRRRARLRRIYRAHTELQPPLPACRCETKQNDEAA